MPYLNLSKHLYTKKYKDMEEIVAICGHSSREPEKLTHMHQLNQWLAENKLTIH